MMWKRRDKEEKDGWMKISNRKDKTKGKKIQRKGEK